MPDLVNQEGPEGGGRDDVGAARRRAGPARRAGDGNVDERVFLRVDHADADIAAPVIAAEMGHHIAVEVALLHLEFAGPIFVLRLDDRRDRTAHAALDGVDDVGDRLRIAGQRDEQARNAESIRVEARPDKASG